MKKHVYTLLYHFLAALSCRLNWGWLNRWKLMIGFSILASTTVGKARECISPRVVRPDFGQDSLDCQNEVRDTSKYQDVFCYVSEELPVFTRGNLSAYLRENVRYPEEAVKYNVVGKVYVRFIVDTLGKVTDVKILRGVHPLLDSAALSVVSRLPDFLPGRQWGKKVRVSYAVPIDYTARMLEETRDMMNSMCYIVDETPNSPWDVLERYVWERVRYPEQMAGQDVEKEKVYVSVTIGKDGSVTGERIVQGVTPELDAEVLRVVQEIKSWKPVRVNGNAVNETYVLVVPASRKFFQEKPWLDAYLVVQEMPEFPGGDVEKFFLDNLRFPKEVLLEEKGAFIFLEFIIDETGNVIGIKARSISSSYPSLEAEVLRVARMMPRWRPGRQDGKPVRVWMGLPVKFKAGNVIEVQ